MNGPLNRYDFLDLDGPDRIQAIATVLAGLLTHSILIAMTDNDRLEGEVLEVNDKAVIIREAYYGVQVQISFREIDLIIIDT